MGIRRHPCSFYNLLLGLLLTCLLVGGCGGGQEGSTLTVLAASSLTETFGELESTFEEQNPGADVQTSFAGSSELLAQIEQGAPADVFASADEAKMEVAVEEGLVAEPWIFARNRPVLIVPADNPAGIEEFQDLAEAEARIVLAQDGVPIAEYAGEILANADAEYGGGFAQQVFDKMVSREANVRAAANRVALREADATFVYQSDLTGDIRGRIRVIEIPENLNVLATYPIAVIEDPRSPELARKWVDLVLSDEGQGVLEKYNFLPAS